MKGAAPTTLALLRTSRKVRAASGRAWPSGVKISMCETTLNMRSVTSF